jgi:hypothetical protein
MYTREQKESSSTSSTSIHKKSNGSDGERSFSVQRQPEINSAQEKERPRYSRKAADLLAANVMRSMEARQQGEEGQGAASVTEVVMPKPQLPIAPVASVFRPSREMAIQRQCSACEQAREEGKDSDEMSSVAGIQTKLTVGAVGDRYEQEADRVAAQVMRMSIPPDHSPQVQRFGEEDNPVQRWSLAQSITPLVQRRVDEHLQMRSMVQRAFQAGGNQASGDLESRLNASSGGGSALAPEVRAFMEPRFGADFSSVRVHTGSEAVQMNRELGAQAFAHGSDVYFGAGKSPGNNELTAHELTHVVQQTSSVGIGQLSAPVQRQSKGAITLPEINIVAVPPASLRSAIGTRGYYRKRNADFVARADAGETSPDYYLNYGDKYVNRFKTVLRPKLSSTGQAWLDCTLVALQTAIEDQRDANPWAFAEIERDNDKFRDFAYSTHSSAYVDCGVCELPIIDQFKIGFTPDFKDLLSLGGVEQILDSFAMCNAVWFYPRGPAVQRRVHDEQVQMRSLVQRAFQSGGTPASGDLESRLNTSKGGGSALAPEVRAFMEPRFGADFSSVRVHTGGEAVQMNRELGAQAFAHGSDVYFGAGKSPGNNELTAHELTHVVQQTGGVQRKIGDDHDLSSPRFAGDPVLEACFDKERVLTLGSSGSAVVKLQQALIDAGFPLPKHGADGKFGSETKAAVKDFQTASGFTGKDIDGIVGSKTMGALDAHFGTTPGTALPGTTPPEPSPGTGASIPVAVPRIKAWINTFIPHRQIEGPPGSQCFTGDNRSFSNHIHASSRTHQEIEVEVGTLTKTIDFKHVGTTHEVECTTGKVIKSGTAPTSQLTNGPVQSRTSADINILFLAAASNPLVKLAPAIDFEAVFRVNPMTRKCTFEIEHDGFPAYEAYITFNGGSGVTVYNYDPIPAGETPKALFPPMDKSGKVSGVSF